jgi:dUTP pyrophosphatase|tara:strand:- start:4643 stop:5107 length:465 start_codon:yes stop_codon:yes gene_type:complete
MQDKIKVELMDCAHAAPKRATEFSVGYDIYSAEDEVIRPLDRKLIRTGIKLSMPVGIEGQIRTRSGLASKHGVFVLNSPGTIDPDYRGEIKVLLFNSGVTPFDIEKGDRIAQLVFSSYLSPVLSQSSAVSYIRGEGGFGSTGINDINMEKVNEI